MKPKQLILWVLLLAVAVAAYFYSQRLEDVQKERDLAKSRLVTLSDPLKVQTIHLAGLNYPKTVIIERRDAKHEWVMLQPVKDKADGMAVGGLIGAVLDARIKQTLKKPQGLKQYGLEPPWVVVTLVDRKGSQATVEFGSTPPTSRLMYARLPKSKEILLVPQNIRAQVGRTLAELRKRDVLDFVVNKVVKLSLEMGGEKIEVEKTVGGLSPVWRFPDGAKASTESVEDALYQLSALQTTDFIDTGVDDKAMGFTKPRARVVLTLREEEKAAKDGKPKVVTRQVGFVVGGKVPDRVENYVRRIAGGPALSVAAPALGKMPQTKKALLYRDMWKVDRDDIISLTIERDGRKKAFAKAGDKWRVLPDGKPGGAADARMFLWGLAGLKWQQILPPKGDYGLDKPQAVITFALQAKEKGKAAVVHKLTVGKVLEKEKLLAAKLDGDDRVFGLAADFMADIPKIAKTKPAQ